MLPNLFPNSAQIHYNQKFMKESKKAFLQLCMSVESNFTVNYKNNIKNYKINKIVKYPISDFL